MAKPYTGPARPLLLLLEDDPGVRRSLQLVLQGQGFEVRAHESAATLFADSSITRAACLVTDYQLAGTTGIDVLIALRGLGWSGPAILITGHGSNELSRRATSAGFDAIFEKPLRRFSLAKAALRLALRPSAERQRHAEE